MDKNKENKLEMVKIEFRKWNDLDIKTLTQISADARRIEGLGDFTNKQVEEYLKTMNERFPSEVMAIAIDRDKIVGWMGIERATGNIGEVGRWQPFVVSGENKGEIARLLISNIIDYAKSNEMTRVEVGFGGISEDNLDSFRMRCSWYELEGWYKLEDTNFMVRSLINGGLYEIKPPDGFELRPLLEFANDTIFDCYHIAFTKGDARWIHDMTEEQRKQEFEKDFDRSNQINGDASFAVLSDGDIVGFILVVSRSDEEEHLESLGVHPNFQGNGLGKFLLGKSIDVLTSQDVQNFTLGVDPVNTPAVRLYEQFGFKTVSRTARYSWKTNAG